MKTLRIAATATVIGVSLIATAPTASANSFNVSVGGGGTVSYNDGTDTVCASLSSGSGYDVLDITVYPVVAGRGPTWTFNVHRGGKVCRSLATAYEDSAYKYLGGLGYEPPCRCGTRFGDDFYS
ncbi:hypothetical protein [Luteipulveratus mongoliensis]|uniref:Uncharacterized protein n=1 Tax=Luteipulveratus mongoliensis TaxID=571913 RepID=A0A0K1JLX7_9MICO|nr:hypothetical protein [Luteipulveratus mongoliensis]AKU17598.1 hypothetical protein VV02_20025 [Luteipulveratus mongoliensis]